MSRPVSEEDLHAYIDGALAVSRRAEIETYLGANPELAQRIAVMARHREQLRAALIPIADEPVPLQLNIKHIATSQRRQRWPALRAAVAAGLVLAGGAGGWALRGLESDGQIGIEALGDEASYTFAVFGADHVRAVEIPATERVALTKWMETKLHRPITMPDLNNAGFALMGGRIVATQNGPAGLLMYSDTQGQRIAVFMRPMIKKDQNARMRQHSQGDVAGFSWADDGMGYSMVGTVKADSLHPLADEARRQLRSRV